MSVAPDVLAWAEVQLDQQGRRLEFLKDGGTHVGGLPSPTIPELEFEVRALSELLRLAAKEQGGQNGH